MTFVMEKFNRQRQRPLQVNEAHESKIHDSSKLSGQEIKRQKSSVWNNAGTEIKGVSSLYSAYPSYHHHLRKAKVFILILISFNNAILLIVFINGEVFKILRSFVNGNFQNLPAVFYHFMIITESYVKMHFNLIFIWK